MSNFQVPADCTSIGELLARAVAADLSRACIAVGCVALQFRYHPLPTIKLAELQKAIATVREIDEQITRISRSHTQHEYFIEVCLRRQVDHDKAAVVSQIKYAMQQVRTFYYDTPQHNFIRMDRLTILDDVDFNELQVVKGLGVMVFRGFTEH